MLIADGALARAHATLEKGAQFLGQGLAREHRVPRAIEGRYRAKVIGNGLRELDRFLCHFVQALAEARGIAMREEGRNTANKVTQLRGQLGLPDPDRARLIALARTRNCLFHCSGLVERPDMRGGSTMTIAWYGAGGTTLRRAALGERLEVSAPELLEICLYYQALAERLLYEAGVGMPERLALALAGEARPRRAIA